MMTRLCARGLLHQSPVTRRCVKRSALVLGIESSCDDTGVAIVDHRRQIVVERLATQTEIHAPWGGVVPHLAQEAHQEAMDGLIEQCLETTAENLDAVAVTVGPGLGLCLKVSTIPFGSKNSVNYNSSSFVGVAAALSVSARFQIPLIPVHHMEAHALVARMYETIEFPFLCLLISGGHNLLLAVHDIGIYTQIGSTLDDCLGETYDKIARMLNLELVPSGGAALEKEALNGDPLSYDFKVPMQKYKNCDFSYSGLKTNVRNVIDDEGGGEGRSLDAGARANIAASFQRVATEHLLDKCRRGIQWASEHVPELNSRIVVAGGVASNAYIREQLKRGVEESGMTMQCPPPRLCTDNGVMIAWAGMERYKRGVFSEEPQYMNESWVDLRPRWPLTDRMAFRRHNRRSAKKKRLHRSLTSMTEERAVELLRLSSTSTTAT